MRPRRQATSAHRKLLPSSRAEAQPGAATDSKLSDGWIVAIGLGLAAFGLYLAAMGMTGFPLAREKFAIAEHVGPITIDTPLVHEWSGRSSGSYRTQRIPLAVAGQPAGIYAPARTLWVRDTDNIRYGQKLRFLVDPGRMLVYEATTEGRPLLSYDETAANLTGSARMRLLIGLGLLALAAWQGVSIILRRRSDGFRPA